MPSGRAREPQLDEQRDDALRRRNRLRRAVVQHQPPRAGTADRLGELGNALRRYLTQGDQQVRDQRGQRIGVQHVVAQVVDRGHFLSGTAMMSPADA